MTFSEIPEAASKPSPLVHSEFMDEVRCPRRIPFGRRLLCKTKVLAHWPSV